MKRLLSSVVEKAGFSIVKVEEVGPTWFEYIDIQERRDKELLGGNVIDVDPNDYPERNSQNGFCVRGFFHKKKEGCLNV